MAECKHHAPGIVKTDELLLFNISAEEARGYPAPGIPWLPPRTEPTTGMSHGRVINAEQRVQARFTIFCSLKIRKVFCSEPPGIPGTRGSFFCPQKYGDTKGQNSSSKDEFNVLNSLIPFQTSSSGLTLNSLELMLENKPDCLSSQPHKT